jgi:hypothetical protein
VSSSDLGAVGLTLIEQQPSLPKITQILVIKTLTTVFQVNSKTSITVLQALRVLVKQLQANLHKQG